MGIRSLSTSSIATGAKRSKFWDQVAKPNVTVGAYDALATITVPAGGASSITFSAIPQTGYRNLEIRMLSQSASAGSTSDPVTIQPNGNYATQTHYLYTDGTTPAGGATTISAICNTPRSGNTGIFASTTTRILNYNVSGINKTIKTLGGYDKNGAGEIVLYSNLYSADTNPITSITFAMYGGYSFSQNSQITLYGER